MGGDDGLIISARFFLLEERCLIASRHLGKAGRPPLLDTANLDPLRIPAHGVSCLEGLS